MVLLIKENNEEKKTIITDFILSHNLYSKAEVEPTDKVCLWLGANVMLEYSNEEAEELLTKNLTQATASMEQTQIDLDFLKFLYYSR
jgi:prefoldin subunit 5